MLDRTPEAILARIADWTERNSRLVSYAGLGMTLFTGALYARFISLPDIPYVTDRMLFWASIGWNGLWWGYIHGAIDARREAMRDCAESNDAPSIGVNP